MKLEKNKSPEQEPKGFGKAKAAAQKIVGDESKTSDLLGKAERKSIRNKGSLLTVWKDLLLLFRMTRAWLKGNYKGISLKAKLYIIAAIIYFVNPIDFIPDFIPLWGYLDDATVIGFVVGVIRKEIKNFEDWENGKS